MPSKRSISSVNLISNNQNEVKKRLGLLGFNSKQTRLRTIRGLRNYGRIAQEAAIPICKLATNSSELATRAEAIVTFCMITPINEKYLEEVAERLRVDEQLLQLIVAAPRHS